MMMWKRLIVAALFGANLGSFIGAMFEAIAGESDWVLFSLGVLNLAFAAFLFAIMYPPIRERAGGYAIGTLRCGILTDPKHHVWAMILGAGDKGVLIGIVFGSPTLGIKIEKKP